MIRVFRDILNNHRLILRLIGRNIILFLISLLRSRGHDFNGGVINGLIGNGFLGGIGLEEEIDVRQSSILEIRRHTHDSHHGFAVRGLVILRGCRSTVNRVFSSSRYLYSTASQLTLSPFKTKKSYIRWLYCHLLPSQIQIYFHLQSQARR